MWEYNTPHIALVPEPLSLAIKFDQIDEELNCYGKDGWEHVNAISGPDSSGITLFLKRKVE